MLLEIKDTLRKGSKTRTKRSCICRCDVCGIKWEVSHCVKKVINQEYHFCSKKCTDISQRNNGIIDKKKKRIFQIHYGVDNPSQVISIKEKKKLTCQTNYGVEYVFQSKEVQEKITATNIERYGVENPQQSEEIQNKTKETCQERYGVNYPQQSKEVQDKTKETNLERYGHVNPAHGEIAKEKIKVTCQERYGVEHPMQNAEVFSKVQKSRRKAITLFHWKTGEELICIASYEVAVVTWLNKKEINFEWQKTFETPILTPTGRKSFYTIDLYILDGKFINTYVEIKGYLKKGGMSEQKWQWFHSQYPNSQLWNLPCLKELEIL